MWKHVDIFSFCNGGLNNQTNAHKFDVLEFDSQQSEYVL